MTVPHLQTPVANKRAVMPNYAGFVPGVKGENLFGRTHTELSRLAFRRDTFDAKPNLYSSTGY